MNEDLVTMPNCPFGYLYGRVGRVVGPRLVARAYELGWDDLGVVDVDFGEIAGYGHVTLSTHKENLAPAEPAERQP